VRLLFEMAKPMPAFTDGSWGAMLVTDAATYDPLLAMLLIFELVANLALLTMSLLLVVLFFQKRTSLPKLYIGFVVTAAAIQLVDSVLAGAIPSINETGAKLWTEFARAAVTAALWTGYFLRSRRVRETFVQTLRHDEHAPNAVPQPIA
jgi:hypothetical protein